jgi:hypothetical protein
MCGYQPFILINQNQTLMGTIPTLGTFKGQDSNNLCFETNPSFEFFLLCFNFAQTKTLARPGHLQPLSVETSPGQAVTTIVTAVLFSLNPQGELNRSILQRPHRARSL